MSQGRPDRPQALDFNQYALDEQLARLRADRPIRDHGRDSLTLVRDPAFDLVLVAMAAGNRLPGHRAPGPIGVLVLDGRIAFTAGDRRLEAGPQGLLTLPANVPHEVEALEAAALLITISGPRDTHSDPLGLKGESGAKG